MSLLSGIVGLSQILYAQVDEFSGYRKSTVFMSYNYTACKSSPVWLGCSQKNKFSEYGFASLELWGGNWMSKLLAAISVPSIYSATLKKIPAPEECTWSVCHASGHKMSCNEKSNFYHKLLMITEKLSADKTPTATHKVLKELYQIIQKCDEKYDNAFSLPDAAQHTLFSLIQSLVSIISSSVSI
ncbi:hypothetical protein TNCV_4908131 [Trichonephila clavipes]|uniref:Uncharacterized protein n=1 Tax=Trichonephila clavipes TaxID=2585209 RepID=A0A8X6RSQ2_TRICX|nr:hypothetical protein TNCV_4908131 [Trichonephila clavipes]